MIVFITQAEGGYFIPRKVKEGTKDDIIRELTISPMDEKNLSGVMFADGEYRLMKSMGQPSSFTIGHDYENLVQIYKYDIWK